MNKVKFSKPKAEKAVKISSQIEWYFWKSDNKTKDTKKNLKWA